MTNQPKWKCIANLGDRNPIEHGGLFVYVDETGVYAPEMEKLEEPGEDYWPEDDDDGDLVDAGTVYWHERYQVDHAIEKLLSGGLFLEKA